MDYLYYGLFILMLLFIVFFQYKLIRRIDKHIESLDEQEKEISRIADELKKQYEELYGLNNKLRNVLSGTRSE